jgi:hypothetical protein
VQRHRLGPAPATSLRLGVGRRLGDCAGEPVDRVRGRVGRHGTDRRTGRIEADARIDDRV